MIGLRRIGGKWDRRGRDNALGTILTTHGRIGEWTLAEFLATGRADVDRFMQALVHVAPGTARTRALDFGCGVGRVTRALADHFDEVVGVDAAPAMIDGARAIEPSCSRCRFVLNRAPNLALFESDSFSVVYCRLVLQHVNPSLVRRYIPELVRVLRPGGVLMFQLPDGTTTANAVKAFRNAPVLGNAWKRRLPRPLVTSWRRLKFTVMSRWSGVLIEMAGLPQEEVLALVVHAGGRILEVRPDDSHGLAGVQGFEYWVTTG